MPELPEVETIVRGLAPGLSGQRIERIEIPWPTSVRGGEAGCGALDSLEGKRFSGTRRRAKLALLDLDDGSLLAVHLKMTGRLVIKPASDPADDPYLRVRFFLGNHTVLDFSDVRRFGWVALFAPGAVEAWDFYAGLGPEPLETPAGVLAGRMQGRRARIKALVLDQSVVAGVGNIYADEALFRAGLRPDRTANRISLKQLTALCRELQSVLEQGIAENGASIRDYRDAGGNAGAFQNSFQVYGRAGEPCMRCGRPLASMKVAGRTSTFCPGCQS